MRNTTGSFAHRWLMLAEHGALRSLMLLIGVVLMVVGLGLGITMIMLPAGLIVGFAGVGLFLWGTLGELPADD